jgi:hypothetical protein
MSGKLNCRAGRAAGRLRAVGRERALPARHLFIELGNWHPARQLDIDWAQLQLDQSTLGKNARIEQIARAVT